MSNPYMQLALEEAYRGIHSGDGGPFGAVVVKDGVVVGRGHNQVLRDQDPTQHGEMVAIRDACKNLHTFDLSGAQLYTTSAPCPMCQGAILWAGIRTVYCGCTRMDAESIGFRDNAFHAQLTAGGGIHTISLDREACLELFAAYTTIEGKIPY